MGHKTIDLKFVKGCLILENKVNEYALQIRKFLIDQLDFLDGEVQEFVPTGNQEDTGVVAMDVKWKSGIHFIFYQPLWRGYYYVMRNNEQISNLFHVRKYGNDLAISIQRLMNDINNGRYDHKNTPRELHLKYVQEKGLTGYMNNTKWDKIFDIIRTMEEETGKEISIMYKYISDIEAPVCYWSIRGDEYLHKGMYKYIEWLKIQPIVCDCEYQGRLIEPKYTYYDCTSLLLEKMDAANLHYEYLQDEEAYIIYGYR